jgi:hypothetical protein
MSEILLHYEKVNPTTWVYLSSLLMIALYFKFSRIWSVRNLDLIGLILLAPGLLFVIYGREYTDPHYEQAGYIWLYVIGGLFVIRMLVDPMMVRRPLLEPNLTVGGLTFLGISLLVFLMANVVTSRHMNINKRFPTETDAAVASATSDAQPARPDAAKPENGAKPAADNADHAPIEDGLLRVGPGYPPIMKLAQLLPTRLLFSGAPSGSVPAADREREAQERMNLYTASTIAILSHLAVVIGMVLIGYRHFDNIRTGIAAAVLYLLLPYTALVTNPPIGILSDQMYHVLLAALLVWAVAMYRRPLVAGILLGLSIGTFYYPIFLLPLWIAFYWQRGAMRFVGGVLATIAVLVAVLYFNPVGASFLSDLRQMFGWVFPRDKNLEGFWGLEFNNNVYRLPVLVTFVAMCITLAIWPAQKNLGTLMSCSAAVMLGTQFWHAWGGGQLMGWYLPLLLLTVFRPNLEDRVALSVLGQWSFARRKPRLARIDQAA